MTLEIEKISIMSVRNKFRKKFIFEGLQSIMKKKTNKILAKDDCVSVKDVTKSWEVFQVQIT